MALPYTSRGGAARLGAGTNGGSPAGAGGPLALTDVIEADVLATLDGSQDPQAVLDRHSSSKGPLGEPKAQPGAF